MLSLTCRKKGMPSENLQCPSKRMNQKCPYYKCTVFLTYYLNVTTSVLLLALPKALRILCSTSLVKTMTAPSGST